MYKYRCSDAFVVLIFLFFLQLLLDIFLAKSAWDNVHVSTKITQRCTFRPAAFCLVKLKVGWNRITKHMS